MYKFIWHCMKCWWPLPAFSSSVDSAAWRPGIVISSRKCRLLSSTATGQPSNSLQAFCSDAVLLSIQSRLRTQLKLEVARPASCSHKTQLMIIHHCCSRHEGDVLLSRGSKCATSCAMHYGNTGMAAVAATQRNSAQVTFAASMQYTKPTLQQRLMVAAWPYQPRQQVGIDCARYQGHSAHTCS